MKVKIPIGLATAISSQRKLVKKYQTNPMYATYATWIACKSLTTSGVFILTPENRKTLCLLLDCNISTLYRYLDFAQKEGFIQRKYGKHLPQKTSIQRYSKIRHLGWNTVLEKYSLVKEFYRIEFDQSEHVSIQRLLQAYEYQENKLKQEQAYQSKIQKNPGINKTAENVALRNDNTFKGQKETHEAAREYLFSKGGSEAELDTLFQANPDFNRSSKTIRDQKNMKSHSTALYEQKVLSKLGLLEITERPPVRCFFTHEGSKELIKGKAPSCNRSYDRDAKVAYWNKPNDIQVRVDGLKVKKEGEKNK